MAAAAAPGPRWGVLGLGAISADFCLSLSSNGSTILAVAARDPARAEAFAASVGARRAHTSYEALVGDPEVDVVYVGTIHSQHADNVKLALQAGKHVLCEKPLAVNGEQASELIELARGRGLFLMEGMWTRFFPAIGKAREVLASGVIGEAMCLQADFGYLAPPDDVLHRVWDPAQAGGVLLDIGIYLVQAALMIFGATMPQQIACTGQRFSTGVDKEATLALTWEGHGCASLFCTLQANTPEQATVICSKGHLRIHGPAHAPLQITVARELSRGKFVEESFTFDLPACPTGSAVNYPHSEGLLYEVQAVEKALQEGRQECPEYSLEESLVAIRILDTCRKQLNVTYPFDK